MTVTGMVSFNVALRYRCPSKINGITPSGTTARLFSENKAASKQIRQSFFMSKEFGLLIGRDAIAKIMIILSNCKL